MRSTLILPLLFVISSLFGQNKIQWSENYKLKLSDFQSPSSQIGDINMYSIRSGSSFDFEFSMSGYEFMFTKNFNDKVDCYFARNAAEFRTIRIRFIGIICQKTKKKPL